MKHPTRLSPLALLAILLLCAPAAPGNIILISSTLSAPTWNRPVDNGNSVPVALSGIGTAVTFEATPFAVDAPGQYDFQSIATNPPAWDNYSFLYHDSFSPASP